MISLNRNKSVQVRAPLNSFLSVERMKEVAPAAFAEHPHESRSQRYGFIPTIDILYNMANEGFLPIAIQQSTSKEGHELAAKHLITFRHKSREIAVKGELFTEITLLNSHNGSSTYRLMSGLYRLVCSNGMVIGDEQHDIRIPHNKNAMDRVIEGSYQVLKEAPEVLDSVQSFKAIELKPAETEIWNRAALALKYEEPENVILDINSARRVEDRGSDLWRTLNRTQENLIRGGLTGTRIDEQGKRRRTTTRAVNNIDSTVNINRGLWILAKEFERLRKAA